MDLIGYWQDDAGVLPPRAEAVAERILSLMVLDMRCTVEARLATGDERGFEIWRGAREMVEGVESHLHRIERDLLGDTVGAWDADTRADVHWLLEAQAVLRWALAMLDETPPHDVPIQTGVFGASELLAPSTFVEEARLRPLADLEACESLWSFWLWRAHAGPFRGRRLLPPQVRENVELAVEQGIVDASVLIEGDVSAFGVPVFRLPEDQQELLTSIATERCRAARWLCGHAEGFYEISLDVSPL